MYKKFINIVLVILWLLVIFLLSSIPGEDYPAGAFDYAIFAHIVEYFVLGFLISRALNLKKYSFKKLLFTIIFTLLIAILDEVYQSYIPMRDVSFIDWLFDALGVFLGIIGYYFKK